MMWNATLSLMNLKKIEQKWFKSLRKHLLNQVCLIRCGPYFLEVKLEVPL